MANYTQRSIELVDGMDGKDINLQALDKNGDPVPLTGCTVKWHIWKDGATSCVLIATCVAVDLSVGKVKYTILAADWGTGKLESGNDYKSSLVATKTGPPSYEEEFINLLVTTIAKAPRT